MSSELSSEARERIFHEELAKRQITDSTKGKKKDAPRWLALLVPAVPFIFVHIVYNVPGQSVVLLAKEQLGFSDTFVNYEALTGIPKIVLLAQHPSVVKQLEKRGIISWESEFEKPISNNIDNPTEPPPVNSDLKDEEFLPVNEDEIGVVEAIRKRFPAPNTGKILEVRIYKLEWAFVTLADHGVFTCLCRKENKQWKFLFLGRSEYDFKAGAKEFKIPNAILVKLINSDF